MPWLEYTGPKPLPYRVPIPCPLTEKSEQIGVIDFNPRAAVEQDIADYLLTLPVFREINPAMLPKAKRPRHDILLEERIQKSVGMRFKSKWTMKAYIKKHGLEELVNCKRNTTIKMWEIVGPVHESRPAEDGGSTTDSISADTEGVSEVTDERASDEGPSADRTSEDGTAEED